MTKSKSKSKNDVYISKDLLKGLIQCYNELLSIHRQFGDYANAKNHSVGLDRVAQYADDKFIAEMDHMSSACSVLKRDIDQRKELEKDIKLENKKDSHKKTYLISEAVDLLSTEVNTKEALKVFKFNTPKYIIDDIGTIYINALGLDPYKKFTAKDKFSPREYGGDSLDGIEIIMELEEHFGIELPDEFVEYLKGHDLTFGDIVELLKAAAD